MRAREETVMAMTTAEALDQLMKRAQRVGWPTDGSRPAEYDRKDVARCAIAYVREIASGHPVVGDELGHNTLDQFLEQLVDEVGDGQHIG
jgi:hypothetical protein